MNRRYIFTNSSRSCSFLRWVGVLLLLLGLGCSGEIQVAYPGCEECPERCLRLDEKKGKCVQCLKDTQCQTKTSPTKRCTEQNRCTCGSDQDCPDRQYCKGQGVGCVECLKNEDCAKNNPEEPICFASRCVACKRNEVRACAPQGVTACVKGLQTCGGALIWGPCEGFVVCKPGEKCKQGTCVPDCPEPPPCRVDERACVNDGDAVATRYKVCRKTPVGCPEWAPPKSCGAGEACAKGVCSPYQCPPPECRPGEGKCEPDGKARLCKQSKLGCYVWSEAQACTKGAFCSKSIGKCVVCRPKEEKNCYSGVSGTERIGICKGGRKVCKSDGSGFGICVGEVTPQKEVCDGKDNDCDGSVDEADAGCQCSPGKQQPCGKARGECKTGTQVCNKDGKWDACKGSVAPQKEVCDGKDNDCDGLTDEADAGCQCKPGQKQVCGKDVGECEKGTQSCEAGGKWGACVGGVIPGQEVCDGKDNNCDGKVDELFGKLKQACSAGKGECKSNGTFVCGPGGSSVVCNAKPKPVKAEVCDGKDNDCDGVVDEGCPCNFLGKSRGVCSQGKRDSKGNCTKPAGYSITETCDGKDNNCNGTVDENLQKSCYTGPPNTQGKGRCRGGTQFCTAGAWGKCLGQVVPATCQSLGYTCGTEPDGCGGTLQCGTCKVPETCGAKTKNVCGCAEKWQVSTIDSLGKVGKHASMVRDSNDKQHVVYYDETNKNLKYAARPQNGKWAVQTLVKGTNIGLYPKLFIDSKGNFHLTYHDDAGKALYYQYRLASNTIWTSPFKVDSDVKRVERVGLFSSIAVDSNNKVHIVYLSVLKSTGQYPQVKVRYAVTSTTLGFAVRTLESGVYSSSESTGIVVDNNNGVHVVHAAILAAPTLRGRVRHYYKATSQSTWTSRNIEVSNSSERPGLHFALARDKSAGLHLVYRSKDYRILRYATLAKVTDAWKISTMTTSLHYGWYIDLMVDSLGTLHTSFQYQLRGHLIYGVKKKSDFAWKFSTVTTQGTTGLFSSLIMNARGSLFISFYDASAADLLIAFLPNCP